MDSAVAVPLWLLTPVLGLVLAVGGYMARLLLELSRSVTSLTVEVAHLQKQRHDDRREDREDRDRQRQKLDETLSKLNDGQQRIHERIDHIAGWSSPAAEQR
jgi:hypothetical protein